jgi:SP family myo-inositol transporter-like MFS transporter 13
MAGFRDTAALGFSVSVAATNMVMTVVALKLVDRVGRRTILLVTVVGVSISLIVLGSAFALLLGVTPYQSECGGYSSHCGLCLLDDRCAFSNGTCTVKNALLATSTCSDNRGWFALFALVAYVAMYALGLGNVPWLIQSEIFSPRLRGKAGGIATSVNWVSNLLVATTFLSLTRTITVAGTFWLYGGISLVGWIFIYALVPETKGKGLEEIHNLFH